MYGIHKSETSSAMDPLAGILQNHDAEPEKCFQNIRQLPFTFLPCLTDDPINLHRTLQAGLCELGRLSVPLAVALTMHLYTLAALATLPTKHLPIKPWKRSGFLDKVRRERWLLASCGSFRTTPRAYEARAVRKGDRYIVSGKKDYVSLAGIADLLLVGVETDNQRILVFAIRGLDPRLSIGDSAFNDSMRLSCTRSVSFNDVVLEPDQVLFSTRRRGIGSFIPLFQRAWFQSLVAAPYLGGAEAALDELCIHAAKHPHPAAGDQINSSDGIVSEVGRSCADLETGRMLMQRLGRSLAEAAGTGDAESACRESAIVKSAAMRLSLEVVQRAFHSVGTDAARTGAKLEQLLRQSVIGPLHPVADFELRRELGSSRLALYQSNEPSSVSRNVREQP